VRINSPKCFYRVARWFYFANVITENKKFTAICGAIHRNELYTGILMQSGIDYCFFSQILLRFGQLYFYSRQVFNKRLTSWTVITDTLTLNRFTRNEKHGFNSWKWSNLAWSSSSSLTIYFNIISICGLQYSFGIWHWENGRMLLTIPVFEKF